MTVAGLPFARRLRYALEAALVYVLYAFFWILPMDAASALGGAICRCIGPYMPSSAVARRNLAAAFPDKSAAELEEIVAGVWNNLGRVLAEYAHLPRIWERVEVIGGEYLVAAQGSGRPSMFFGAHLANWEVGTISSKKIGLEMHPIYRRPNNPWVDGILHYARGAGSLGQIAKGASGAREMLSVLRNNGSLAILMDQKLNEGMAIPFFGRDAMTATALASFALKFKCPVHPVRIERTGGCRFRMTVYPALDIPDSGDREKDTRKILTEVSKCLEEWIRERPEQWLWIHQRWPK